MKKIIFIFFMAFTLNLFSQVAINNDGTAPDPSAMLQIKSNDKGLLIPQMTETQRDNISSPATGLTVFVTDGTDPGFYYYDGSAWIKLTTTNDDDHDWTISGDDMYSAVSGNVGIGTNNPSYPFTVITSTSNIAGYLINTSSTGTGLLSTGNNTTGYTLSNGSGIAGTGTNTGIFGYATDNTGTGVAGAGNNSSSIYTLNDGSGIAGTGTNTGIFGYATDSKGTGIVGAGNNGSIYTLDNGSGVAGTSSNIGVYGYGDGDNASGIYGNCSSGTWGYIATPNAGLYGYGDHSASKYAAIFDPNNNAVILVDGDNSDPIIRCNNNDYGRLGTSSYHWWDVYSYYIHYHSAYTFDTYDDLELLDNMIKNAKIVWDPKLKHHIMIIDKKDLPKCISSLDENGEPTGFIDAGRAFGLTTGAIRQLNHESKSRDSILTKRTNILAYAAGVDFNKAKDGEILVNINDFGNVSSDKSVIKVEFSDDFKEKIKNDENIPIVNITPTSPYNKYYISKIDKKGFEITVDKPNTYFSFNWIAFAKVKIKEPEKLINIDNVFYKKSFKVSGTTPVYNGEDIGQRKVDKKTNYIKTKAQLQQKIKIITEKTKQIK